MKTSTYRQDLHQIPEIGFNEFKTSKYLVNEIKKMGFEPITICKTGIYVYIDLKKDSTVSFRSDMDGLKITEQNNIPYKSTHKGYMHACGHDGHMAIALGFLNYLSSCDLSIYNKNILVIFQPAEEGPGGAKVIIETGIFKKFKVEAIYGIHLFPLLDEGKVYSKNGPLMSGSNEININFKGISSHIAIPENGKDSIYATSLFLTMIKKQIKKEILPYEECIVGFGSIKGGTVRNIISDNCRIEGTIRTFTKNSLKKVYKIINDTLIYIEKELGVLSVVDIPFGYSSVINNSDLYNRLKNLNLDNFVELENPYKIAEDFSFYQEAMPGLFMFIGTKNEELGFTYPLHSSKFNFKEDVLDVGVETYKKILISY